MTTHPRMLLNDMSSLKIIFAYNKLRQIVELLYIYALLKGMIANTFCHRTAYITIVNIVMPKKQMYFTDRKSYLDASFKKMPELEENKKQEASRIYFPIILYLWFLEQLSMVDLLLDYIFSLCKFLLFLEQKELARQQTIWMLL